MTVNAMLRSMKFSDGTCTVYQCHLDTAQVCNSFVLSASALSIVLDKLSNVPSVSVPRLMESV